SYQKYSLANPDYPDSLNNSFRLFSKMGELEQSVQYYKRAISKAPDFEEAYVNLGNVLNELNHFDEAVHFYNKAIEINPNSEHTYTPRLE
ncbi:tetratricopeptide repeat protein, partial [Candidatus Pseudothioglobus singularis]|uniref:tetratricopeptide repeat protein n=1 Tax=Candidatus Pseudothioglobus singularis TaxID=1427364 RepID=UPI0008070E09